jgi:schlafen family protein
MQTQRRKGPTLVAVRNFVLVEVLSFGAYIIAGSMAHFARIYRSLPFSELLSFQVAQAIFIFGAQTLLILLIFFRWQKEYMSLEPSVQELMSQPEHENLEFKSTLRWDLKAGKVNRALEKAAMKTVAAFLNSRGGTLVLGVDDARTVVGLHHDIATLQRQDEDGFETHFSNVFRAMIGPEFRQFVRMTRDTAGGKACYVVSVVPSAKPVYLRDENTEEFFIRTGNGTTSLKLSEVASYIDSRFRRRSFFIRLLPLA